MIKARIIVTLKKSVLDPQGKAILGALGNLGFKDVHSVHQGKIFDIELDANNKSDAEENLQAMCDKLLANMVIEDYSIEIV